MLPVSLDLRGRRAVVIGAGTVGCRRAGQLVGEGARVRVVAKEILAPLPDLVEEILVRPYRTGDLSGALIAVAAVGDQEVNDAVRAEAARSSILLNVVDDPFRSNVYFPAIHRDGPVAIAVSTEGASPALASYLRDRLAAALPNDLARVASTLREERRQLHRRGVSTESINWTARIAELLGDSPAPGSGEASEIG